MPTQWNAETFHGYYWEYGNELRGPWSNKPITRIYGVSSGNGNDGVSQSFADYYVMTDDPWTLARAAMLSEFEPGKGYEFALETMDINGEEEYGISAMILDPPADDDGEEGESWSDVNGAWLIIEVFPEDNSEWIARRRAPVYDSLEDCFTADVLELARKD